MLDECMFGFDENLGSAGMYEPMEQLTYPNDTQTILQEESFGAEIPVQSQQALPVLEHHNKQDSICGPGMALDCSLVPGAGLSESQIIAEDSKGAQSLFEIDEQNISQDQFPISIFGESAALAINWPDIENAAPPTEPNADGPVRGFESNCHAVNTNPKNENEGQIDLTMENTDQRKEATSMKDNELTDDDWHLIGGSMSEIENSHDTDLEDVEMEESPWPESPRPESPIIEYNLRPSARIGIQALLTWYDDDDTGDYDPEEEKTQRKTTLKQVVRKSRQTIAGTCENADRLSVERVKRLSHAAARHNGVSLVLTFMFESETGKEIVKTIPDNWPAVSWNVLSDDNIISPIPAEIHSDNNGSSTDLPERQLRRRASAVNLIDDCPPVIPDPAGIEIDLIGHPEARGCRQCRELCSPCTLLESYGTWPCFGCIESGEEHCELITPPSRKRNCDECLRQKIHCSYYDGSDTSTSCIQCQKAGSLCTAAPAPDGIRKRISYDGNNATAQEPLSDCRSYVTCTACRTARGKRCSLKSFYDYPPCKSCEKAGIKCSFDPIPMSLRKAKKSAQQPESEWVQIPQPDSKRTITASVHGLEGVPDLINLPPETRIFKTMLHHPIQFLYKPKNEQEAKDRPCAFCKWEHASLLSVLGFGWRYVLVTPLGKQGLMYREVKTLKAQHPNQIRNHLPYDPQGKDRPFSVCIPCTIKRTYIVGCEGHEMRPLETMPLCRNPDDCRLLEVDQKKFDVRAMYGRLHWGASGPRPTDLWCSLCISPALYRCCTPQETDMWGSLVNLRKQKPHDTLAAIDIKQGDGCGLLLCDECYLTMLECGGDIDGVIDQLQMHTLRENPNKSWIIGERADAELLRKDGLLMKNVWARD